MYLHKTISTMYLLSLYCIAKHFCFYRDGIRVRLATGLEVLRWDTGKARDRFGGIEMGYG